MKITILLVICSSLAFAQDCPEHPPMECSPAENWCSGGYDYLSGCQLPDTCEPKRYGNREPGYSSAVIIFFRYGNDGYPCAGNCPVTCAPDETHCPGNVVLVVS